MEPDLVRKYSLEALPDGRLPTLDELLPAMEELLRTDEQPEEADPLLVEYIESRPSLREYLIACLELEADAGKDL